MSLRLARRRRRCSPGVDSPIGRRASLRATGGASAISCGRVHRHLGHLAYCNGILIGRGSTMDQGFPPGPTVSTVRVPGSVGGGSRLRWQAHGWRRHCGPPPAPTRTWTTARSTTTSASDQSRREAEEVVAPQQDDGTQHADGHPEPAGVGRDPAAGAARPGRRPPPPRTGLQAPGDGRADGGAGGVGPGEPAGHHQDQAQLAVGLVKGLGGRAGSALLVAGESALILVGGGFAVGVPGAHVDVCDLRVSWRRSGCRVAKGRAPS